MAELLAGRRSRQPGGAVDGNSVTYAGALPGVDVTFTATSTGVKETLTLRSALATPVIPYLIKESSDLTASLSNGGVAFTRGSGTDAHTFATVPQPWISDARDSVDGFYDAITSTLVPRALTGQLLTETVATSWLADPTRAFPVTIDPSLVLYSPSGHGTDCLMRSGHPDTSYCGTGFGAVGNNGDASGIRRVVTKFGTGPIPGWALVDAADLQVYEDSLAGASTIKMDAYQNTMSYDTASATWNNSSSGGPSWSGGSIPAGASAEFKEQFDTSVGWHDLWLTRIVQGWADHDTDNNGVVLRSDGEGTAAGVLTFQDAESTSNQPVLNVFYSARTGSDNIQTYLNKNLSDRTTLGVDPGTGNVLVTTKDMSVAGTGPQSTLRFTHYYNSMDAYLETQMQHPTSPVGQLGNGWLTDNTSDASITIRDKGDGGPALIVMPGGIQDVFVKNSANNDFDNPDGVDADLSYNGATGNATLVDHHTGLTYTWSIPSGSDTGYLTSIKTAVGNTINLTITAPGSGTVGSGTVTDTKGREYDETDAPFTGSSAPGYLQSISDNHGSRSVQFGYDNTNDRLNKYIDATRAETDFGYDPATGQLNDIRDPVTGRDASMTYYTSGQFAGMVHTVGQSTTTCSNTATHTVTSTYSYSTSPDGDAPTSAPFAFGETTVIDAMGRTSRYYWDNKRRVIKVIDAGNNSQSQDYDSTTGQTADITDFVTTASTTLAYTGREVSSITEPKHGSVAGAQTKVQNRTTTDKTDPNYQGPQSVPTDVQDPQGNDTYYTIPHTGQTYGGMDLITHIKQTTSGTTNATADYTYNTSGASNGEMATSVNANSQTTSYSYNSSDGNLQTITPPSPLNPIGYTEDADNRVHTRTDGNGNTSTYSYDGDDRPTRVDFADSTYISYSYDTDGNLTQRHNRDGSTDTIGYDGQNQPTSQNYQGENQSFCWDDGNDLTSLTDGGGTVTYHYSGTGFLDAVTEPGGSGCQYTNTTTAKPSANSRCIAVQTDGDHRPTAIAYPGGVLTTTSYLPSGKTGEIKTQQGSTTYQDLTHYWRAGGGTGGEVDQLQSTQDQRTGTPVETDYSYDGLNRLTSATNLETGTGTNPSTQDESWTYDLEGNITKTVYGSTTTNYHYNNADQLCWTGATTGTSCASTPSGDTSYNYDTDGNATSGSNGFAAAYDAANVTSSTNSIDTGGTNLAETYTDFGQNQRTTLGNTNYTNSILGLAASTIAGANRTDYTRLPTGQLISMRVGPVTSYDPTTTTNSYYSMIDHQNSTLGLTDASGNVAARYAYNPYGKILAQTGSLISNRLDWLAQWYSPATDTYHLGARYYSPTLMRFTQTDPKPHQYDLTQQDQYTYAGDNPTNSTDLSGAGIFDIVGWALGAVATVAGVAALAVGVTTGIGLALAATTIVAGEGSVAIGGVCSFAECP